VGGKTEVWVIVCCFVDCYRSSEPAVRPAVLFSSKTPVVLECRFPCTQRSPLFGLFAQPRGSVRGGERRERCEREERAEAREVGEKEEKGRGRG